MSVKKSFYNQAQVKTILGGFLLKILQNILFKKKSIKNNNKNIPLNQK